MLNNNLLSIAIPIENNKLITSNVINYGSINDDEQGDKFTSNSSTEGINKISKKLWYVLY